MSSKCLLSFLISRYCLVLGECGSDIPPQIPDIPPEEPAIPLQVPAIPLQVPDIPPEEPDIPPQVPAILLQVPAILLQFPAIPLEVSDLQPEEPNLQPKEPRDNYIIILYLEEPDFQLEAFPYFLSLSLFSLLFVCIGVSYPPSIMPPLHL